MTRTFKPTDEMVRAAEALFLAMAHVDYIKPIVNGYQQEILERGKWFIRPEYLERLEQEIILDPKNSYLMGESDFAEYDAQCKAARVAANLPVDNPDQCPLLVAEHQVLQAEHALIETLGHTDVNRLLCAGLDKYKEYVDLSLKLMAPFVRDASAILAEVQRGSAASASSSSEMEEEYLGYEVYAVPSRDPYSKGFEWSVCKDGDERGSGLEFSVDDAIKQARLCVDGMVERPRLA